LQPRRSVAGAAARRGVLHRPGARRIRQGGRGLLRLPLRYVVVALFLVAGCGKTDTQRAAEERAKIAQQIEKSFTLVPYRGLKTVLRSKSGGAPPGEIGELHQLLDKTLEPPADGKEAAALY